MDIQRWTDEQMEKMSEDDVRDCLRYVRSTLRDVGLKHTATIVTHAICRSIDQSDLIESQAARIAELEGVVEKLRPSLRVEKSGIDPTTGDMTWAVRCGGQVVAGFYLSKEGAEQAKAKLEAARKAEQ